MTTTCPHCCGDVSKSEVERMFDGEPFPVFQCVDCMKRNPNGANSFVLMPGGAKVAAAEVQRHLERMGGVGIDIAAIMRRAFGAPASLPNISVQ